MKKLLIIMETMAGGGAEKVLIDLLNAIDRQRYDITLLLVFKIGPLLEKLPDWLEVRYLYPGKPKGLRRFIEHFVPGRNFLYRRDAQRLMRGRHFDIAVSFLEGPALRIHNCLPGIADRNITWNHTNLSVAHWTHYLYSSIEDEANDYRSMDAVVFVSEGARTDFSKMFGVYGDNLKVVPNILDYDTIQHRAQEFEVKHDRFTLIAVGRLVEVKRYDRILEAAKILASKGINFNLWILGAGPLEKELKKLTASLQLNDKVIFHGFQPNPYPYFKAADLMLMASDTEGYGMAMVEAMALGTPVVATASSGAKAVIGDGTGILTDFSAEEMANAIESLYNDTNIRNALAEKAYIKAKSFDKENVLNQIYEILEPESLAGR